MTHHLEKIKPHLSKKVLVLWTCKPDQTAGKFSKNLM